jgi:hypothetical protein
LISNDSESTQKVGLISWGLKMSSAHCYMLKNGKYLPAGQAPIPIKVPPVKSTGLGSKLKTNGGNCSQ